MALGTLVDGVVERRAGAGASKAVRRADDGGGGSLVGPPSAQVEGDDGWVVGTVGRVTVPHPGEAISPTKVDRDVVFELFELNFSDCRISDSIIANSISVSRSTFKLSSVAGS